MFSQFAWLSPIGTWITAATSGAIAAWFLSYVRERYARPRLVIEINNDLGSTVETDTTDQLTRQRYARLVVHNEGRTMAKNCCAAIDYIKRTDPTGTDYIFRTDLLDLKWSLFGETLRHVPARGYRLLDVAHCSISVRDLNAGNHATTSFWIDAKLVPQRLIDELRMNATYDMHLRIYGDNAAPAEFSCRVNVGSTSASLTIQRCANPRP